MNNGASSYFRTRNACITNAAVCATKHNCAICHNLHQQNLN